MLFVKHKKNYKNQSYKVTKKPPADKSPILRVVLRKTEMNFFQFLLLDLGHGSCPSVPFFRLV